MASERFRTDIGSAMVVMILACVFGGAMAGFGVMEERASFTLFGGGLILLGQLIFAYYVAATLGSATDFLADIAGNQAAHMAKKQAAPPAAATPAKVDPADQFARKLGKPES